MPAHTLSGADADAFEIGSTSGQITVKDGTKLDFEAKRTMSVVVTANDQSGEANATASITVTIKVTDLDEQPNVEDTEDVEAPNFQTVDYNENETHPVVTLGSGDPEGVTPTDWAILTVAEASATGDENAQDIDGDGTDDVEEGDAAGR